jgi:hypothetical protein
MACSAVCESDKRGILHAQPGGNLAGFSVKSDRRTSARQAHNFAIPPAHAVAPARAQSLHRRFFGGETRGVALHPVCLRVAVASFARRINALQKAVAKAFDRLPDARNLRDVDACADDHIFSSLPYSSRSPR